MFVSFVDHLTIRLFGLLFLPSKTLVPQIDKHCYLQRIQEWILIKNNIFLTLQTYFLVASWDLGWGLFMLFLRLATCIWNMLFFFIATRSACLPSRNTFLYCQFINYHFKIPKSHPNLFWCALEITKNNESAVFKMFLQKVPQWTCKQTTDITSVSRVNMVTSSSDFMLPLPC